MAKLSLRDLDVRGKRVLVRVDFNVPVETRGGNVRITDDTRIRESLPTINFLREHGAKTILISHFGRPKGKAVEKYSLRPVGDYLHSLIHQPVIFSHDTVGDVPRKIIEHMENGDVALLENVRFQPGEEANDPGFAKAVAALGDFYVNDAFGAAHRAHASTAEVTKFVEKSAVGLLMEKELKHLRDGLENPARPFVVILGGAKVSDKIGVLRALMEKADSILIGGAMANTFLKAQGIPVGASRVESDKVDLARELLDLAKTRGVKLLVPIDAVEAEEIQAGREYETPVGSRRSMELATAGRSWTLEPPRLPCIRRRLQNQRQFCGTGLLGFLRFLSLRREPSPSPKRSRNREPPPLLVAATR